MEDVFETASGARVAPLSLHPGMFIDRTTTLYGPSKTGKTVIIKAIMALLNDHVPEVLVVAPTEPTNRSYAGTVDAPLIQYRMYLPPEVPPKKKPAGDERAGALRFLNAVWQRQEMKAAISTRVNDPRVLRGLFERARRFDPHAARAGDEALSRLARNRDRMLGALSSSLTGAARTAALAAATEKFDDMLVLVYKKHITPLRDELWRVHGLDEDEMYTLNYLHFNPRLLLIFDDCAAELKPFFSSDAFRKIFYQNRHVKITALIACQDDTDLPSNLRKNSFVNFFTTEQVTSSNFTRVSNRYPKAEQQFATDIGAELFRDPHRKLAYIREDPHKFYYVKIPPLPAFHFGSAAVRELCAAVGQEGVAMDQSNPFFSRFAIAPTGSAAGGASA
jgi:hypothetical protein